MNENDSGGGIGICGILLIVFIVLKLTDNIDWSWWWVLSPIWLPFVILFPILFLLALLGALD